MTTNQEDSDMGVALYIVLEKPADFDPFVNGKALSRSEKDLARIAEKLGVKPLMSFFSAAPEEANDFLVDEGIDPDAIGLKLSPLEWFEASEGLHTIKSLLRHMEHNPGAVKDSAAVTGDLKEFERILAEAEKRKLRWHLAVDY
jgi:hypothetical protein